MSYSKISFKSVIRIMNWWPPYFGAGIRVKLLDEVNLKIKVSMPLRKLNSNYVGVHFGGSLYSMVDPFYMLILMRKLGRDYIVCDKSATIDFKKPGRDRVSCIFEITQDQLQEIIEKVDELGKYEPIFEALIYGESSELVARVEKKLWVRKK